MGKLSILYLWALVPYAYLITYTDVTRDMVADGIAGWVMAQVHALDAHPELQRVYMLMVFAFILVYHVDVVRNPPEQPS